jgi:sarcosine oxidase, subunit beta
MARSVSTLVIGGGVIGASVAWHLAARGERDILIVDAAPEPGLGSTGRATGGYRGQFATAINVRLSLLARAKLLRFAEDTGVDPEYRPVGYLFLADTASDLNAFAEARTMQHDAGLTEACALSVADAARINPHVNLDGVIGAAWCPSDGTIRPLKILRGYLEDAARRGVRTQWNASVQAMTRDTTGNITSVTIDGERIAVQHVVNAAGAWASHVAALAGYALPVAPARRQIACTHPLTQLDDGFPMTIWTRDAFHLRVRDGRALLNWPIDTPRADPYALDVDQPLVDSVWAIAKERVPVLRDATLDAAAHWVGLYEMSPDKTVLLGRVPACQNLVLANGSSGHGVMHSPILGQLVAELICDGKATSLNIHPLRPERFAEGDPLPISGML